MAKKKAKITKGSKQGGLTNSERPPMVKLLTPQIGPPRPPCNFNPTTLQGLLIWIEERGLDADITDELKEMAKKYPHQALDSFKRNFMTHHENARNKIRKRQE